MLEGIGEIRSSFYISACISKVQQKFNSTTKSSTKLQNDTKRRIQKSQCFQGFFTRCNTIKNGVFRTHNPEVGGFKSLSRNHKKP